ncbi:hypothetical protein IMSAGC020_00020 [Lachnospiraceae bacterium]|nr:hypothetical protein IMSAGC020_00020 [Lachnospiraceae bacterium]
MKLHLCPEINPPAAAVEDHILSDTGGRTCPVCVRFTRHKVPLHMHLQLQRSLLCDLECSKVCDLAHLFLIEDINVPRIKIKRLILEHLEHVGALSFWHHIPGTGLIIQPRDLPVLVQGYLIVRRLYHSVTDREYRGVLLPGTIPCQVVFPSLLEGNKLRSHSRNILYLYISHALFLLRLQFLAVLVSIYPAALLKNRNRLIHRPSGCIDHRIAVFLMLEYILIRFPFYFAGDPLYICIIFPGILVNLMDGRTGDDIVELVCQYMLPSACQLFLLRTGKIPRQEGIHHGQPFRPAVEKLHLPVHALIVRLACVGAPVIFQIQLPVPGMHVLVRMLHRIVESAEIFSRRRHLHVRKSRNLVKPSSALQHIPVHAAAPVAVTKGDQQILIHLLVTVCVPHSLYRPREQIAVVSIEPGIPFSPRLRRRDEVRQDLAAVDPLPLERIVRHTVILIPADLGGHEGVDPRLFQDLRKRPGIAEHVRQPQKFHVPSELLLDEPAAKEYLARQGFPACQVAVGLYPHAAVRLPASLFHSLLDIFKYIRELLFHILIELRLCLEEYIFRVHLHQAEHGGERARAFLSRMLQTPQPCHVNVGVPHAIYIDHRTLIHPVDAFIQHVICLIYRPVEAHASRI